MAIGAKGGILTHVSAFKGDVLNAKLPSHGTKMERVGEFASPRKRWQRPMLTITSYPHGASVYRILSHTVESVLVIKLAQKLGIAHVLRHAILSKN